MSWQGEGGTRGQYTKERVNSGNSGKSGNMKENATGNGASYY